MSVSESEIIRAGVAGLSKLYAANDATPEEVVNTYLKRIDQYNPELNAVLHVLREEALIAAASATHRWQSGSPLSELDGVPIGVKANIAVKNAPWHAGIKAYENRYAEKDAEVVARLKERGAVILGILNMEEGALGAKTDNPWFGPCYNPHKSGYTAGGSSGGSGAAVAAGLCAGALGTDTMGSVRVPSAYCGIYGLKPTKELVSTHGVVELSASLDHVGPHARSVSDIRLVLSALSDSYEREVLSEDLSVYSFSVLCVEGQVELAPDVHESLSFVTKKLRSVGASISETRFENWDFGKMRRRGLVISEDEGWHHHSDMLSQHPEGFSDFFRSMLEWGYGRSAVAKRQALADINSAHSLKELHWPNSDFLILPTTPQTSFRMDLEAPVNQADLTAYANFAGVPAMAIPVGINENGLPLSVQLIAKVGDEARLIHANEMLDAVLDGYSSPVGYGF